MPNGLRRTSPLLAVVNSSGLVISITTRPLPTAQVEARA